MYVCMHVYMHIRICIYKYLYHKLSTYMYVCVEYTYSFAYLYLFLQQVDIDLCYISHYLGLIDSVRLPMFLSVASTCPVSFAAGYPLG